MDTPRRGHDENDIRELWDRLADDWQIQVGDEGDANRRLNSDPVLWTFLGDVAGRRVLDAGCGTGYLTRQLAQRGALVTGIDVSARMIALAREASPGCDVRVDSCTTLATIDDGALDAVVANYVVMDVPGLTATMAAFGRVLRPDGIAVLIFSHPCFPQARTAVPSRGGIAYTGRSPTSSRAPASTRRGSTSRRTSSTSTGRSRTTGRPFGALGSTSSTSRSRGSRPTAMRWPRARANSPTARPGLLGGVQAAEAG